MLRPASKLQRLVRDVSPPPPATLLRNYLFCIRARRAKVDALVRRIRTPAIIYYTAVLAELLALPAWISGCRLLLITRVQPRRHFFPERISLTDYYSADRDVHLRKYIRDRHHESHRVPCVHVPT